MGTTLVEVSSFILYFLYVIMLLSVILVLIAFVRVVSVGVLTGSLGLLVVSVTPLPLLTRYRFRDLAVGLAAFLRPFLLF